MTSSRRKAQGDLETVINQPLEGGESSNHANTDGETVPKAPESDIAVDSRHGFSSALAGYRITSAHQCLSFTEWKRVRTLPVGVQLANHHICRVTDDRASNTRNVPTQETHPGLLQRVVALLWLPQCSVDVIDRRLKSGEFHHGVRNLAGPKRV